MIISPDDYLLVTDLDTGKQEYVWTVNRVKGAWLQTYRAMDRALKTGRFNKLILLVGIPASI